MPTVGINVHVPANVFIPVSVNVNDWEIGLCVFFVILRCILDRKSVERLCGVLCVSSFQNISWWDT